ncbi:hypothetical protein BJ980_001034 [Nocardioides daedukensis]|uniref:AMP-dependent synthetase/ligase domain-containing protein n=1 Tax=Nocardioides daedukensis TaxID=634462 RepID=A0A7Y9RZ38_9ACTN|nr:hypothetical protein [Nocardioides daedukensis]NYG58111.1 hypothetical protein [Nocardioides daedukensis]
MAPHRNRFFSEEHRVALAWFRTPSGDDPGTLNLTYNAVDLPVIRGHATDPAVLGLRPLDFAGLLELVGAVAGAFRSLGVEPGRVVGVDVSDPHIELVTFLATARLGAVFSASIAAPTDWPALDLPGPHMVVTDREPVFSDHVPVNVVLVGREPSDETRELTWDLAVRAGRTDPAGCEPVAPGTTAYVLDTAVPVAITPADDRLGRIISTLSAGKPVDLTPGTTP